MGLRYSNARLQNASHKLGHNPDTESNLTANQIQFVDLVIDYLTQSGWMRAAQLYDSTFTDFSPKGVEGLFSAEQVTQLLRVLDDIRNTAET